MRFSSFVLKNVFRRRVRSTLTMTGMAVAVGAVVALVGISDSFKRSFLEIYSKRGVGLVVSRSDVVNPLTGTFKEQLGQEIADLDGVQAVCPGLLDLLSFENLGLNGVMIQGWPAGNYMFGEVKMIEGESVGMTDAYKGKKAIMLGKELAANAKLSVGATVNMSDEDYHVVGIYDSISGPENGMAVLRLEDAQKLTGKAGMITGCTVRVKDSSPEGVKALQARIEGPLAAKLNLQGKIRAKPPGEFVNTSSQIRVANAMAWMTSSIALFIGFVGMLNTMIMSVFERTREIGILRAIGWRPSRILQMILMESVLLSIGGGILGTLAGIGLICGLSHVPLVAGVIQGAVGPEIILKGFVIAILVGVIGAAYPAYRAARLLPTEALRHE